MCLPVLQVGAGDLLQKEVWFLHWVSYELATTPTPAGGCPFPDYRQNLGKITLHMVTLPGEGRWWGHYFAWCWRTSAAGTAV